MSDNHINNNLKNMADFSSMFSMFDYFDLDLIKGGDTTENISDTKSDDGGLLPSIWGPPTWKSLHAITFGYPLHPTIGDKIRYKLFFRILGYSLPCKSCRESYIHLITTGDTALRDEIFDSRDTLTYWLYNLHNAINEKINVKYDITYEDVVKLYESFRTTCKNDKCVKTKSQPELSDKNKKSAKSTKSKVYSVPYELAMIFSEYAKQRGLNDFDNIQKMDTNKKKNQCNDIIKYMNDNNIKSIEQDGPFSGYPTGLELQLIARQSSNIEINLLTKIASSIQPSKKYKFSQFN